MALGAAAPRTTLERIETMDNPILAALLEALNTHIDARIKAALDDRTPEIDMDKLRELVVPIVASQVEAVVASAIDEHCGDHDHELLDNLSNYDLDDFVCHDDVDTKVSEALDDADLSSKIKHELKYNMTLSVSVD